MYSRRRAHGGQDARAPRQGFLPDDLGTLHVDGVRQLHGLALRRADADVRHAPVARVLDEARLLALGRDVDEGDADDGLLRQPRGREDPTGSDDLHVLDAYVAELAVA